MSRQVLINTLREYFASKGGFMTAEEYKEATDAPYRYQIVKRTVGTWPRLKNLLGYVDAPTSTTTETVEEVVEEVVEKPVVEEVEEPAVAKKETKPTEKKK